MTIKIFLGNLSSDTTSDKLRPLFEKYGEVVECDVLKNFGFVHMNNKNDANKAIAQLDGYSLDGNNIRVELSTGKKGSGGGGGKFDKKGFNGAGGGVGGGPRGRPYGPPPPRDGRDFGDRYPYPLPPYDRYDPYYRLYMEREAYFRMGPLADRGGAYPPRDRYPPLPRERLDERYREPDARDRLPPPRSFMEDRARALPDPYFRGRDPISARPPPEYYDRKPLAGGRGAEPLGNAGAGLRGAGFGAGDFFRGMDRPGGNLGGGAGLGNSGNGPSDYLGRSNQNNYGRQNGPLGGGGKPGDSQSSFATDAIFF